MKPKRKALLTAFWVAVGLLVLAAGGVLNLEIARYVKAKGAEAGALDSLRKLYEADPFPSDVNVEMEQTNLVLLQEELGLLGERMSEGQIEPADWKQPTVFLSSFWDTVRDLRTRAERNSIGLPPEFGFGFDRYLRGVPPAPDDVPRLAQQLAIVRSLCDILYSARVSRIARVSRQEFEGGEAVATVQEVRRRTAEAQPDTASEDRDAGVLHEGALFTTFAFTLEFEAKEAALLETLNRMASNSMFIVVREVETRAAEGQVLQRAASAATATPATAPVGAKAEIPPAELRVVSGRESPMTIRLVVEVYRFRRKAA